MSRESEALDHIRLRLENLWKRIQDAPWSEKQELRLQYHVAYEVYRRQKLIEEYEAQFRVSSEEQELMRQLENSTKSSSDQ